MLTYNDELQIAFTGAFEYVNNSAGSGIEDVSWWRPLPPDGFYSLGDLTHPGFGDANGVGLIATVKGVKEGALKPPTGFTKVGTFQCDRINHLWFWRPTPPAGYVSLGLVVGAPGDTPPSHDVVMCIRADLVVPADIGDMVWGGHGDESLARLWGTKPRKAPPGRAYFQPGTFVGINTESLAPPKSDPSAYSLRIEDKATPPREPLPRPKLQGYDHPDDPDETVAYRVTLPWFAVRDPQFLDSPGEQFVQSPKYFLDRTDHYHLVFFGYNEGKAEQTFDRSFAWGTNATASHEFSSTTSISFTVGWSSGDTAGINASFSLTQSFTVTDTTTQGWSSEETQDFHVVIPPESAVAVYTIASEYTLYNSQLTEVAPPVPYTHGGNSVQLYYTQFPD